MARVSSAPNLEFLPEPPNGSLPPAHVNQNLKSDEWIRDNHIFHDAKTVAIDYTFATNGKLPSYQNLEALYYHNFINYPPEEVLRACQCESIEEFEQLMRPWYSDEVNAREADETATLEEIIKKRAAGELPDSLFRQYVIKDGKKILKNAEVSNKEKLVRYCQWTVLDIYREDPVSQKSLSDETLVNIIMGRNATNGSIRAGFPHGFLDRRKHVSMFDLEQAAEFLGFTEYTFPELRENLYRGLREAGKMPRSVPLDNKPSIYRLRTPEIYLDSKTKALLIGKTAVKDIVSRRNINFPIVQLGDLIANKDLSLHTDEVNPNTYKSWAQRDYLDYGRWLLQILEPTGLPLDRKAIRRASKLGLGPAEKTIIKGVGSGGLSSYLSEIGVINQAPRSKYEHLEFEDYVAIVRQVAADNNGRVTKALLMERIKSGKEEPNPKLYEKKWGYSNVLKAAGVKVHNEQLSEELCLEAGEDYYRENGILPNTKVIKRSSFPYSDAAIYKYFGSIPNFHRALEQRLTQRSDEVSTYEDQLAA